MSNPIDRWETRHKRARAFLRENGIGGLVSTVWHAGLCNSLMFIYRQGRFAICGHLGRRWDRRHGVDTGGQIDLEHLDVVGSNRDFGRPALSTSPRTFEFLACYFPPNRGDFTYIDVGSGKGRTLLLASSYGFRAVIGIEFAGYLCEVARRNLATFRRAGANTHICSVVHADATQFVLPGGRLVVYLGNPFAPEILQAFLDNMVRSYRADSRKILLICGGSVREHLREYGRRIAASGIFHGIAREATTPFFIDSYSPWHYEVFETKS